MPGGFFLKFKDMARRVVNIKSARSASIVMVMASFATKPIGYLRFLFVAAAFGASMEMDVFNVALGVVGLCVGTGGVSLENAVLPMLAGLRAKGKVQDARDVMSFAWWAMVICSLMYCVVILIAPGVLIKLFAAGFDQQRMEVGRVMLWCLLPYSVITGIKTVYDTWAQHTERYTLGHIAAMTMGTTGLISLLVGAPLLGAYSLPLSYSVSLGCVMLIMALVLRDFPYRMSRLPWQYMKELGRDFSLCLAMVGVGTIYGMTDRYFASMLQTGSITSISYADFLFGLINAITGPMLLLFLAKSSKLAAMIDTQGESQFNDAVMGALRLVFVVFTPFGIALAATSRTWVRLLMGYGAFSAEAVVVTAECLGVYGMGFSFMLGCTVFYRVVQARRRLPLVIKIGALTAVINVAGDWYLSRLFGAPGILGATVIAWGYSIFIYGHYMMPGWWRRMGLKNLAVHVAAAAAWCTPLAMLDVSGYQWAPFVVAPSAVILGIAHYFIMDYFGFMNHLPAGWRPRELLALMTSWIKRGASKIKP